MLNLSSMTKSASRRREALQAKISSTRKALDGLENELDTVERILDALSSRSGRRGPGRPKGVRGGMWRPGRPGRPPKWYVEQQKSKSGRKTAREKEPKRKRKASPKMLAALAKAREALAAKRAGTQGAAK
jgi:hypothetical protein